VLRDAWDIRLLRCLNNALFHAGYQHAVEAALWYEQCHTLHEASLLTMESECLQILPETYRRKFLSEISLVNMPGDYSMICTYIHIHDMHVYILL
jgi:hypothetical protein